MNITLSTSNTSVWVVLRRGVPIHVCQHEETARWLVQRDDAESEYTVSQVYLLVTESGDFYLNMRYVPLLKEFW